MDHCFSYYFIRSELWLCAISSIVIDFFMSSLHPYNNVQLITQVSNEETYNVTLIPGSIISVPPPPQEVSLSR